MRKTLMLTVAAALLATPALAGEGAPAANPTVLLNPVALPVVTGGRLVNYIYVTIRISLSPRADASAMRAKEPYFRDALVRAAHRTPFNLANDTQHVDEARLKASLFRDATAIAGPGMVTGITLVRQQSQHWAPVAGH